MTDASTATAPPFRLAGTGIGEWSAAQRQSEVGAREREANRASVDAG